MLWVAATKLSWPRANGTKNMSYQRPLVATAERGSCLISFLMGKNAQHLDIQEELDFLKLNARQQWPISDLNWGFQQRLWCFEIIACIFDGTFSDFHVSKSLPWFIFKNLPLCFQSCRPTRDHLGRSTGIPNPAWHPLKVVPRVDQTTGSAIHPQPTLPPDCLLGINTEPTTSIGHG